MVSFKSYEAMVAARTSTLSSTQRHVLNAVALRADAGGACWAAVGTIARDCGLGERAVQQAIGVLEELGVLVAERRPGRTTEWTIVVARVPQQPPHDVHPTHARRAPPEDWSPPHDVHPTPAPGADTPARRAPDPSLTRPVDPHPAPNPRPGGPGAVHLSLGALWVADQAEQAIRDVDADQRDEALARWARGEASSVDAWLETARGPMSAGIDGRPRRQRPRGVPSGIRRRDVAAGLLEAVRRIRARAPPADTNTDEAA
jgi:hypothetical protein